MMEAEKLSLDNINKDLTKKFSNDTMYVKAMHEAYTKCFPHTQKKMQAFRQMPLAKTLPKRGCSPFSGMLLGCTYMEYFKNCPSNRWTENSDCALAKQFVEKCGLGAV